MNDPQQREENLFNEAIQLGNTERTAYQDIAATTDDDQLLAINEALDKLASQDKQKAELVKLRFFVGLTIEQSAELLGISVATAKRHWTFARAWLYREIAAHQSAL